MKEPTNVVFMWEDRNGNRRWDAVSKSQMDNFIANLVEKEKINIKTLMIGYNPIFFHWVGISDVNFGNINDEISEFEEPYSSKDKNVKEKSNYVNNTRSTKKIQTKFGWLSPDGRYFHCEYFGHSALADKIVGSFYNTANPERFLEIHGWVKIVKGHGGIDTYDIIMDEDKKLTNEQFKVLD